MITEVIEMIEESILMEEKVKSDKKTGKVAVQKIQLTQTSINRYIHTQYAGYLSRFRADKNVRGYILLSGGKVAGAVAVEKGDDGYRWIQGLEVSKPFQKQGFGKMLLDLALSLEATHLTVPKSNKEAIHLYLTNGFSAYRQTGTQYYMSNRSMGRSIPIRDPLAKKKPVKEAVEVEIENIPKNSIHMDGVDCVINLDNFENGLYNFVLVIGLPGSGKGTFGRKLVEQYNAIHIELDVFDQCGNMTEKEIKALGSPYQDYILEEKKGQWYWKNAKTLSLNEKLQGNHDFIEYTIAYCKAHRDNLFVIDGTPIYAAMEPNEISNYPIIIKGTSAQASFANKVSRDLGKKSKDKLHSNVTKQDLEGLIGYYWGDDKYLARFKDRLLDEDIASVDTKETSN